MQPNSLDNVKDTTLQLFSGLKQKKTRFQKAKELANNQKKYEELQTSLVYNEFVESFECHDNNRNNNRNDSSISFRYSNNETYNFNNNDNTNKIQKQSHSYSIHDLPTSTTTTNSAVHTSANKKPREIDNLLNEMKNRQNNPELYSDSSNSYNNGNSSGSGNGNGSTNSHPNTGDHATTNLHVGNLNPTMTGENSLYKYMWLCVYVYVCYI